MKFSLRKIVLGCLLVLTIGLVSGCETTDPGNADAKPWNSPKGWESGLPSSLNEGR